MKKGIVIRQSAKLQFSWLCLLVMLSLTSTIFAQDTPQDSLEMEEIRDAILNEVIESLNAVEDADSALLHGLRDEFLNPLMEGERATVLNKVRFPFYYGRETLSRSSLDLRFTEIFTAEFCAELNDLSGYRVNPEGNEVQKKCRKAPPGFTCIVFFKKLESGWQLSGVDLY